MDVGSGGSLLTGAAAGPAATLLAGLWRAAIGGALFAVPVGGACRLMPRLPASSRFWLWWLVCAKLIIALALSIPLASVISPFVLRLPAQHPAIAPAFFVAHLAAHPARFLRAATTPPLPSATRGTASQAAGVPSPVSPGTDAVVTGSSSRPERPQADNCEPKSMQSGSPDATGSVPRSPRLPSSVLDAIPWLLALLWALGVAAQAARLLGGWATTRRILKTAVPANAAAAAEAERMARRLRVCRIPRVVCASSTASPFVGGAPWRPVIVLPAADLPLTSFEVRMALAHEMAHVARRDLWLSVVPTLAECLFFFLPPARRAARECAACREEACDAAAVAATGGKEGGYARLLIKVAATAAASQGATALGMAPTTPPASPAFSQMQRRLRALQDTRSRPLAPRIRRAAALLVAICLPGLLPWRLRALPHPASLAREAAPSSELEASLPRYRVVDLGTLGGAFSAAYGIGEDGTVVGTANVYRLGGRGHAALWRPGGQPPRDLAAGSVYRHSLAYAVNARGETAAAAYNQPLKPSGFLWSPETPNYRHYLGTLPGFRYSAALGINDEGLVAGVALRALGRPDGAAPMRAFLWRRRDGRMRDLGTLGGRYSAALAISGSGAVAGKADTSERNTTHAFLRLPGDGAALQDLGVLPGGRNSAALSVNRSGVTVGYSEAADSARRAFRCAPGGVMEDLGALSAPPGANGGAPTSVAYSINDAGLIVGASSYAPLDAPAARHPEPPSRAVAWLPLSDGRHRLADLNDQLLPGASWTLEAARGVNGRGEIVGIGRVQGKRHAFLLIPTTRATPLPLLKK